VSSLLNILKLAEDEPSDRGAGTMAHDIAIAGSRPGKSNHAVSPQEARVRPIRPLALAVSPLKPLLSSAQEDRTAAEQYRIVRTRLIQHPSSPSVITVSSPGIGDGKTVTAINLAAAFALKTHDRVLFMDGDLRRPASHLYLGVQSGPGLGEILRGSCEIDEALFQIEDLPNFSILTAGMCEERNSAELFDSPRWRAIAEQLRLRFRYVIIDCPPVDLVADYDLIAAAADGTLLVLRTDQTDRSACNTAVKKVQKNLLGIILNDVDEWFLHRKSSDYEYSS
jgi:capsular exopolysaccharide synthesis family protein